jgi:hypothetical protein
LRSGAFQDLDDALLPGADLHLQICCKTYLMIYNRTITSSPSPRTPVVLDRRGHIDPVDSAPSAWKGGDRTSRGPVVSAWSACGGGSRQPVDRCAKRRTITITTNIDTT